MGVLLCGRPPFVSRARVTPHGKTAEAPYSRFFHTPGAVFSSGCSLQPTKMWRVSFRGRPPGRSVDSRAVDNQTGVLKRFQD
jgi:hypothetical protein